MKKALIFGYPGPPRKIKISLFVILSSNLKKYVKLTARAVEVFKFKTAQLDYTISVLYINARKFGIVLAWELTGRSEIGGEKRQSAHFAHCRDHNGLPGIETGSRL